MSWAWLDVRPILVAIAGPNGAGKTTFYRAHLSNAGLRFVNADQIAGELGLDAYAAAEVASALRTSLVEQSESFVFETVFSDPAREKIEFLKLAKSKGYTVSLCFIGLDSSKVSEQRVAMRVSQGGHDVPSDKLKLRYPRTLINLQAAIAELPHVLVFDNSNLSTPFRLIAVFENGFPVHQASRKPAWFNKIIR